MSSDQSQVNPTQSMARNVGDFTHDLTTLAELQAKLLAADVREMKNRMAVPIGLAVVSMLLVLSFFITLLEGVAYFFVERGVTRATGFGLSALCGLILAGALFAIAWFQLRGSFQVIKRSQEELVTNLRWLRATLKQRSQFAAAPKAQATRE